MVAVGKGIDEPDPGDAEGNGLEPPAGDGTPSGKAPEKKERKQRGAAAQNTGTDEPPAAEQEPEPESPKEYTPDESAAFEELVATMPMEYAMRVVIPFGFLSGKTLGQVSIEKPQSLAYYLKQTNSSNVLKAAVQVLMNNALKATG